MEDLSPGLHKESRKAREFMVHVALHSRQMQSDDLHLLFRTYKVLYCYIVMNY